MTDLYQTLGTNKKATPEEIKNAYKQEAFNHHPDRGGSQEAICKINEAYAILADPGKRKTYDETGNYNTLSDADVIEEKAKSMFVGYFINGLKQNLKHPNLLSCDIISVVIEAAEGKLIKTEDKITECKEAEDNLSEVMKRLEYKGTGNDLMKHTLDNEIASIKKAVGQLKQDIKTQTRAIEMLREYKFRKKRGRRTDDMFAPTGSTTTYSYTTSW